MGKKEKEISFTSFAKIQKKKIIKTSPPKQVLSFSDLKQNFQDSDENSMSTDSESSEDEGEFGYRSVPLAKYDPTYTISASFHSGVFGYFYRPKMPEVPTLLADVERKRKERAEEERKKELAKQKRKEEREKRKKKRKGV